MRTTFWLGGCLIVVMMASVGCSGDSASFSVLPDGDNFQQNTQSSNTQIDVLFIVDNSGSMATSQTNLSQNFPTFIDGFVDRNLNFQMAVAATDNFISLPSMTPLYNSLGSSHYLKQAAQSTWAQFRDGGASHSGIRVINNLTPNIESVFVTNATLGTNGLGDERSFQSMKTTLDSTLNPGFVRSNSFLAVIILTDEDDFSNDGTAHLDRQYTNPALHTVASYKTYLDTLTGSDAVRRRYNVHSIAVQDNTCRAQLGVPGISTRVNELATITGGLKISLCDDFAASLELIADNIIELSTQFYLSRVPIESSIIVKINGANVPNVASNPGPQTGGWWYNPTSNSVLFQGDYIPPQGSNISINFDPVGLGQ